MLIANHAFLVTGGGSGLGAACARLLAARGGQVVIADIDRPRGEALAAQLGAGTRFAQVDVTVGDDVAAAIDAARREFGLLRGVIHCAGILAAARVVGKDGPHDLGLFRRVVETNLVGTFNVLRLAADAMSRQPVVQDQKQGEEIESAAKIAANADGERGVIVNTSSVAAFEGQIGQAAYAASKGGVAAMTLPLARELARHGIRVVAIAPGIFATPMTDALPQAVRAGLAAGALFPARLGRPEEFAALACHAIENPMLNGAVLRLDGGVRMPAK